MLIYPDTNIYFRPFDDWKESRIASEGKAALDFWRKVEEGQFQVFTSGLTEFEINKASALKRRMVQDFLTLKSSSIRISQKVENDGIEINEKFKIPAFDSLHIAFALEGKVDYFLTCDDDILKKALVLEDWLYQKKQHFTIINPIALTQI